MKAFLAAIVATVVISFGADYLLNSGLEFAADQAFTLDGVSVPQK